MNPHPRHNPPSRQAPHEPAPTFAVKQPGVRRSLARKPCVCNNYFMSISLELPPKVADQLLRLAQERGVRPATIVSEITTEALLGKSAKTGVVESVPTGVEPVVLPENPADIQAYKIYRHPKTGFPVFSPGHAVSSESVRAFLEQDEDEQIPD